MNICHIHLSIETEKQASATLITTFSTKNVVSSIHLFIIVFIGMTHIFSQVRMFELPSYFPSVNIAITFCGTSNLGCCSNQNG